MKLDSKTIPVTALVVCRNEADLLPRCLDSLAFCDQIIVIDLKSSDDSVSVAKSHGAETISHPLVPIGEMARAAGLTKAKHKWLLIIDPDEEITHELAKDITKAISDNSNATGVISVPWFNYFKGKPLKGTVWGGGGKRKRVMMHTDRAALVSQVHSDFFTLKDGFHEFPIPAQNNNWLKHYWVRSWSQFLEKHRRYIKLEGEARSRHGEHFRWRRLIKAVPFYFWQSYIGTGGYKDGLLGLNLSVFWVWYNFMGLLSLRAYQNNHHSSRNNSH